MAWATLRNRFCSALTDRGWKHIGQVQRPGKEGPYEAFQHPDNTSKLDVIYVGTRGALLRGATIKASQSASEKTRSILLGTRPSKKIERKG